MDTACNIFKIRSKVFSYYLRGLRPFYRVLQSIDVSLTGWAKNYHAQRAILNIDFISFNRILISRHLKTGGGRAIRINGEYFSERTHLQVREFESL